MNKKSSPHIKTTMYNIPKYVLTVILAVAIFFSSPLAIFSNEDVYIEEITDNGEKNSKEEIVQSQEALEASFLEPVYKDDIELENATDDIYAFGGDNPDALRAVAEARAVSSGFIQFNLSDKELVYIYETSTSSVRYRYVSGSVFFSGVIPFYDRANGRYKITISGMEGWVNTEDFLEYTPAQTKGPSHYEVKNGNLYHYISYGAVGGKGYGEILNGPAPSYLKAGSLYYSSDGHYFYSNVNTMISDYASGSRTNSVNQSYPFYNYYQYLSYRTKSNITAAQLDSYIKNQKGFTQVVPKGQDAAKNQSMFVGAPASFFAYGTKFGHNPLISFGIAINESGWGRSWLAINKNNMFGHSAYDSKPNEADDYPTVDFGIKVHSTYFLNWFYLDFDSPVSRGGYLGDKSSGINVSYASDPHWGEKAAAHYYALDKHFGSIDYNKQTIGITLNASQVNLRKEPSTASAKVYNTEILGQSVLILGSTTGESINGNNIWYKIASDPLLDSNRNLLPWITGGANREANYNYDNSYVYIHSSNVRIVAGKDAPKPPVTALPRGDINGDGKVTVVDLAMMKSHMMGVRTLAGDQFKRADINGDGKITVVDLAMLKSHMMGIKPLN
ncbi:endo-beta-N-acetylglucosaminidase [Erysipelothrix sp. HDW6C]|uniref:dockerin type I domain-containing protein n=1 Tax=Erysipelothrix sp. HDW6C TaxID=2714930 RepID=UPI00140D57F7|nr:dockerin type I domain-containing protein [Erysipelothrix sp. HDW6C]QIK69980.1 endo-beta-N-acetylglucosaminidase [Erysipelothrix sp. HDW6C]